VPSSRGAPFAILRNGSRTGWVRSQLLQLEQHCEHPFELAVEVDLVAPVPLHRGDMAGGRSRRLHPRSPLPFAAGEPTAIQQVQPIGLGAHNDGGDLFAIARPLPGACPAWRKTAIPMQPVYVDGAAVFHLTAPKPLGRPDPKPPIISLLIFPKSSAKLAHLLSLLTSRPIAAVQRRGAEGRSTIPGESLKPWPRHTSGARMPARSIASPSSDCLYLSIVSAATGWPSTWRTSHAATGAVWSPTVTSSGMSASSSAPVSPPRPVEAGPSRRGDGAIKHRARFPSARIRFRAVGTSTNCPCGALLE
jgi:hypothetical protein